MKITRIKEFEKHVLFQYPKESCGIIVKDKFISCENIAENPIDNFSISDSIYKEYGSSIQGIVHSHTTTSFKVDGRVPSKLDMLVGKNLSIPSGIVHCDGENVSEILWFNQTYLVPLLDRPYIPNVFDCYNLVRDYHTDKKTGISKLPVMERDEDWVEKDPGILLQGKETCTDIIPFSEAKVGDILLYKIGSQYENHVAVIIGEDLMLHHLATRPSSEDKISKWKRQLVEVRRCRM